MNGKASELPFLDLGNESRVSGAGKFFGFDDHAVHVNLSALSSSCLLFPFSNSTETSVYGSYKR